MELCAEKCFLTGFRPKLDLSQLGGSSEGELCEISSPASFPVFTAAGEGKNGVEFSSL